MQLALQQVRTNVIPCVFLAHMCCTVCTAVSCSCQCQSLSDAQSGAQSGAIGKRERGHRSIMPADKGWFDVLCVQNIVFQFEVFCSIISLPEEAPAMQRPPRAQQKARRQLPGGCQVWQRRPPVREPLLARRPRKTLPPPQLPTEWQVRRHRGCPGPTLDVNVVEDIHPKHISIHGGILMYRCHHCRSLVSTAVHIHAKSMQRRLHSICASSRGTWCMFHEVRSCQLNPRRKSSKVR